MGRQWIKGAAAQLRLKPDNPHQQNEDGLAFNIRVSIMGNLALLRLLSDLSRRKDREYLPLSRLSLLQL